MHGSPVSHNPHDQTNAIVVAASGRTVFVASAEPTERTSASDLAQAVTSRAARDCRRRESNRPPQETPSAHGYQIGVSPGPRQRFRYVRDVRHARRKPREIKSLPSDNASFCFSKTSRPPRAATIAAASLTLATPVASANPPRDSESAGDAISARWRSAARRTNALFGIRAAAPPLPHDADGDPDVTNGCAKSPRGRVERLRSLIRFAGRGSDVATLLRVSFRCRRRTCRQSRTKCRMIAGTAAMGVNGADVEISVENGPRWLKRRSTPRASASRAVSRLSGRRALYGRFRTRLLSGQSSSCRGGFRAVGDRRSTSRCSQRNEPCVKPVLNKFASAGFLAVCIFRRRNAAAPPCSDFVA